MDRVEGSYGGNPRTLQPVNQMADIINSVYANDHEKLLMKTRFDIKEMADLI